MPPIFHSLIQSMLRIGVPTAAALTTVARLLHYLPSSGEWIVGFPTFHYPSPAPWPAPLDTGAAGGQALVSSVPPSTTGPLWTMAEHGPQAMDRVHRLFNTKIIRLIQGNSSFTNNPHAFFHNQPVVHTFIGSPSDFKNNSKYTPSHFQKL
jgi:hypothetical protein